MLRRLHIDNFKSLVNFDLELGRTHLLLGRNGTGKSAVFAALSLLRRFLHDDGDVRKLFAPSTCTHWEKRTRQTFELQVESGGDAGVYQYRLEIEFVRTIPVVMVESLTFGESPLFRRKEDSVQLFRPDGSVKPGELLVDEQHSALPRLTGRHSSTQLEVFRRLIGRMQIVSLNPALLRSTSLDESSTLAAGLENYPSWYRHLMQDQPSHIQALHEDLRQLFGPEFQNLRLVRVNSEQGSARELRSEWRTDPARSESRFELGFDELSDGQRALICLYTLLHADADEPTLLCIDEPDNYVALSELQPWLGALAERSNIQTLLISHHPEIINFAADTALYFYRRGQGPTRVKNFSELVHPDEPLTAAELVARGWVDADP